MVKDMNIVIKEKKVNNVAAREFYINMRSKMNKNVIDLVKKAGLKPAKINSDMALFKEKINDKTMIYYYDRMEIKQGNITNVVDF